MVVYLGSKRSIAKEILPIILKDRKPDQTYAEPFIGGANSFELVTNPRIGTDSNKYLIGLLKAMRDGHLPNQEKYPLDIPLRTRIWKKELPIEILNIAYAGYLGFFSFGGQWWSTDKRSNSKRNYKDEYDRHLAKQGKLLQGSRLGCCHYKDLEWFLPEGRSIIYCDPPYEGKHGYKGQEKFNHAEFWDWCRMMSKNHDVFISSYQAPDDFECLWSKEKSSSLCYDKAKKTKTIKKTVEKLFKYKYTDDDEYGSRASLKF